MDTPYKQAWTAFRDSKEFERLMNNARRRPDSGDQYIENRFRAAFDAGWRAGLRVDEVSPTAAGKEEE